MISNEIANPLTKTVFVSGNFNILHPGHLRLLRFARELGDRLVVGVQSDRLAGESAHVLEDLRLEGVRSNIFVTESFLIDESVEKVIDRLRPDFVVKGKEHETRPNPELEMLSRYGGQLVFSSGEAVFSSVDLIRKDLVPIGPTVSHPPTEFLARHGIDSSDVVSKVNDFVKLQVCDW